MTEMNPETTIKPAVTLADYDRQRELAIVENKQLRVDLDALLQRLKDVSRPPAPGEKWTDGVDISRRPSRNRSLAITHLEDCIMRLGMDLKDIGTPNPYPNSYNPGNTIVDKTADGLKL